MPDIDDLTAFLAMVTSDADSETTTHRPEDCADWRNSCSAHNAMRLAVMVAGALGLAGDWMAEAERLQGVAREQAAAGTDKQRRGTTGGLAVAHADCARALREAVTAALTRDEPPGA
jgi:hypothetical protein